MGSRIHAFHSFLNWEAGRLHTVLSPSKEKGEKGERHTHPVTYPLHPLQYIEAALEGLQAAWGHCYCWG